MFKPKAMVKIGLSKQIKGKETRIITETSEDSNL